MNRSDTITELAKALTKLQGELTTVPKTKVNPFHHSKYADLADIWEMARPKLMANGLSLVQTTDRDAEHTVLETTLLHTSGEWIASKLVLSPVKDDPQGVGSALTYGRRYSMSALLGIASDEDDDANAASGKESKPIPQRVPAKEQAKATFQSPAKNAPATSQNEQGATNPVEAVSTSIPAVSESPATEAQLKALAEIKKDLPVKWSQILKRIQKAGWKVEKVSELTQAQAAALLKETQAQEVN